MLQCLTLHYIFNFTSEVFLGVRESWFYYSPAINFDVIHSTNTTPQSEVLLNGLTKDVLPIELKIIFDQTLNLVIFIL